MRRERVANSTREVVLALEGRPSGIDDERTESKQYNDWLQPPHVTAIRLEKTTSLRK